MQNLQRSGWKVEGIVISHIFLKYRTSLKIPSEIKSPLKVNIKNDTWNASLCFVFSDSRSSTSFDRNKVEKWLKTPFRVLSDWVQQASRASSAPWVRIVAAWNCMHFNRHRVHLIFLSELRSTKAEPAQVPKPTTTYGYLQSKGSFTNYVDNTR